MPLTRNGYVPRLLDPRIDEMLQCHGAVLIQGAKYCGKTWTAMSHANSMYRLDDESGGYAKLMLARADVGVALDGERPRLIDEWQMLPAVWDGVRHRVDDAGEKGMFILSGSSSPADQTAEEKATGVKRHSGIGRICPVRMRTMTLYELGLSDGTVPLRSLFDGTFRRTEMRERSVEEIADMVRRGGWPGNLRLSADAAARAVSAYPDEFCGSDLPLTDPGKDPDRMRMLLRSLARNESTTVSDSRLASDMGRFEDETIDPETVTGYLATLRRMFLLEEQPAFDPNIRSSMRVGKAPKRHLADPAMSCALLRAGRKALLDDPKTLGFMFEGMCERDLDVYAGARGGRLFHYRDGRGNEVDAVVELEDGRWAALEVKLGMGQVDSAAEKLLGLEGKLLDDLAGHSDPGRPRPRPPDVLGVVCGMAPCAYRREDGVYVLPPTVLRDRPRTMDRPRAAALSLDVRTWRPDAARSPGGTASRDVPSELRRPLQRRRGRRATWRSMSQRLGADAV